MAHPRCLFVGQALQMPHWYGLCQLVLCLVQALANILGDRAVPNPAHVTTIQIQVCLDTTHAMYLVIRGRAQSDKAANGVTDIPVARRYGAPGRTIDHPVSHHGVVVVNQLRTLDMLQPQLGVRAFSRAAGTEEYVALALTTHHDSVEDQRVASCRSQSIHEYQQAFKYMRRNVSRHDDPAFAVVFGTDQTSL